MDFWEKKDMKMSTDTTTEKRIHTEMFYVRRGVVSLSILLSLAMGVVCTVLQHLDTQNNYRGAPSLTRMINLVTLLDEYIIAGGDGVFTTGGKFIPTMWWAWTIPLFAGGVAWLILPGKKYDRIVLPHLEFIGRSENLEIGTFMPCIIGVIIGIVWSFVNPGFSKYLDYEYTFNANTSVLSGVIMGVLIAVTWVGASTPASPPNQVLLSGLRRLAFAGVFFATTTTIGLLRGIVSGATAGISILFGTFITILVVAIARKGWKFVFPPQFAKTEEATK